MHAFNVDAFLRDSIREICNEKLIGRAGHYYSSNAAVHVGCGETRHGSDQVPAGALEWLGAFPDARAFVDEVIWSEDAGGYSASLRLTVVAHNTGPSRFGPATGRRVVVTGIVNSRIRNERIVEQWIECDEAALIRQMGFDAREVVERQALIEPAEEFGRDLGRGVTDWGGQSAAPPLPDASTELKGADLIEAAVSAVWNGRLPGAVPRFYASTYRERVAGREIFGREEVQAEVLAALSAFPDLRLHVDEVVCREERGGQRTSTRWTLLGTNTGHSAYGPPSDRYVRLTGISNHRIRDSRFQEGWTEYSALSLQRQLARPPEGTPESSSNE